MPLGGADAIEEHVVHVGAGVGYYTAILAELVGAAGTVTAIEFDAELAARATANFARTLHVRVVHGDGTRVVFEPADVIYVNAGATRPADAWLEQLKEGGRLILPLTADGFPNRDVRHGAVFRIERRGSEFFARRISGVAIFPCEGVVTWPAAFAGRRFRQGRRRARDQAVPARRFAGRPMLAARARLVPGLPLMRSAFSSGRPGPWAVVLSTSVFARRQYGATMRSSCR